VSGTQWSAFPTAINSIRRTRRNGKIYHENYLIEIMQSLIFYTRYKAVYTGIRKNKADPPGESGPNSTGWGAEEENRTWE